MGLDLIPQAKAKAGYEGEWRSLIEKDFCGVALSETDVARFQEITVPPYATLGAPRVGFDPAADAWIVKARNLTSKDEIEACLREFHGYYAIALIGPPAIPEYSNGDLYQGIDKTSVRGAFLSDCEELLGIATVERAWTSMWPGEALAYGKALLDLVARAERKNPITSVVKGWFSKRTQTGRRRWLRSEQIDIARAAADWYVFWGNRGHPIKAWF